MLRLSTCILLGLPLAAMADPVDILFIGNSYTFGRTDPAMSYNAANVTDLTSPDQGGSFTDTTGSHAFEPHPWGGVPGIFKQMTDQAGLDYNVYLSTRNAASLRGHLLNSNPANWDLRGNMELRTWDKVVLQEQSANPLAPSVNEFGHDIGSDREGFRYYSNAIRELVQSPQGTGELRDRDAYDGATEEERQAACEATGRTRVTCSRSRGNYVNPNASPDTQVYLYQTWARPNLIHGASETVRDDSDGSVSWTGTPSRETHFDTLEDMTAQLVEGYQQAFDAALQHGALRFEGIAPVGQAFLSAVQSGVAARDFWGRQAEAEGSVNLWFDDGTHASKYGSYLSALTLFGETTGLDPLMFGRDEIAARDMGISAEDAFALQRVSSFLLNLMGVEATGEDIAGSVRSAAMLAGQSAELLITQQEILRADRLRTAMARLQDSREIGRFTPYAELRGGSQSADRSGFGSGDSRALIAHIGGSMRGSERLSLGGAISVQRSDARADAGDLKADTLSAGLNAAWSDGAAWIVSGLGYSRSRLSGHRDFSMVSGLGYEFLSERFDIRTDARTLSAGLAAGRWFAISDALSLGPVAAFDYHSTTISGHSEDGPVRRAVSYAEDSFESLELQLGGQVRQTAQLASRPVTLSADARYVRELADGRPSSTRITDSAGNLTAVPQAGTDRSYGRVSLAAEMAVSQAATSWIAVDGRIGHRDGTRTTLNAGIAMRF